MKKIIVICLMVLLSLTFINVFGEENLTINGDKIKYYGSSEVVTIPSDYEYNLFEMRGMWVSTVWNGDFNSCTTVSAYKYQFNKILDCLESYNFNTVLFQIRPSNDAFYISSLNPFSEWMTGTQGRTIKDENGDIFDPLAWMIEVTHSRNMQFFGWLNAYRISARTLFSDKSNNYSSSEVKTKVDSVINGLDDLNFAKKYPEYVLLGDSDAKLILNPGEKAVRKFLISSIEEIVRNYDIDGVHFDDYFYLDSSNSSLAEKVVNSLSDYLSADTAFNDNYNDYQTYINNRSQGETLGDFRRRSVNEMIQGISVMIDNVNEELGKTVEFGSKPAAVWTSSGRSINGRVTGANVTTYAYSSYYDIYADSLYWAEMGWVDWIAPQIYFNFSNSEVPYADIVKWWAQTITESNKKLVAKGKDEVRLYIAHGVYRLDTGEPLEKRITDATELNKQLLYNQKYDVISGSAFYDYSTFNSYTNVVKETKANLKTIWDLKTIPVINTDLCELIIKDVEVSDNLLTIQPVTGAKAYIIYEASTESECIDSNVVDVIYVHEDLSTVIDSNKNYIIKVLDDEYAFSRYSYQISNNINYINSSFGINETFEVSKEYTLVSNDYNNVVISENDFNYIITGEVLGNDQIVFEKDGNYYIYNFEIIHINYFNVYITEGIGYTLTASSDVVKEGEEVTFYLKIDDEYNLSKVRIKINNSYMPISDSYTFKNVKKDLDVSILDVVKNTYEVVVQMGETETILNVLHGEDVVFPEPLEIVGKEFYGWSSDGKIVTCDQVIKAIYVDKVCNVSLYSYSGIDMDVVTVFYNECLDSFSPTRKGYKFVGWYLDSDCTMEFLLDNPITEDITLYAKWEKTSGCNSLIEILNIFFTFSLLVGIMIKNYKK